MVPMFTCGLVRSNLALATMVLLRTDVAKPGTGLQPDCYGDLCVYVTRLRQGIAQGRPRPSPAAGRLLALALLDDFLGYCLRNLRVAFECHRVHGAARGLAPQVTDVTEHL